MTSERNIIPQELVSETEFFALQYLKFGRKDWDEPHTRAVVHYAGILSGLYGLDQKVIVTAAWLHDTGYFVLFEGENSDDYLTIKNNKEAHMERGAKLARTFLETPEIAEYFTDEQKERVIHLVSVHDKIEELKDMDEIVLMEADTLGAIDIGKVATTFDKESGRRYLKGLYERRVPKFRTELGIKYFASLIEPFKAQFKQNLL